MRHQNYFMKNLLLLSFFALTSPFTLLAQVKKDTVVVGGTTIITKTDSANGRVEKRVEVKINGKQLGDIIGDDIQIFTDKKGTFQMDKEFGFSIGGDQKKELKNIENSWFVLDLGFY